MVQRFDPKPWHVQPRVMIRPDSSPPPAVRAIHRLRRRRPSCCIRPFWRHRARLVMVLTAVAVVDWKVIRREFVTFRDVVVMVDRQDRHGRHRMVWSMGLDAIGDRGRRIRRESHRGRERPSLPTHLFQSHQDRHFNGISCSSNGVSRRVQPEIEIDVSGGASGREYTVEVGMSRVRRSPSMRILPRPCQASSSAEFPPRLFGRVDHFVAHLGHQIRSGGHGVIDRGQSSSWWTMAARECFPAARAVSDRCGVSVEMMTASNLSPC